MVKLAIIFADPGEKLSARLTMFFTGCAAYHIGFVDEENDKFYDMHLIRRRRIWSQYSKKRDFILFDTPGYVPAEYLELMMDTCTDVYGMLDYALFGIRGIYHLFGASTRNAGGVICSEMVNMDIIACGGDTPWLLSDQPPSPCDWFRYLMNTINNNQVITI
jgi:hypothetical protein